MTDHAIAEGDAAEHGAPAAEYDVAAAQNGHGAAEFLHDAVVTPLPTAVRERSRRRWVMHALVIDVAMLVLANMLFLLMGAGYGLGIVVAFDAIVVGLVASWHGYTRRLRLNGLDDLRVTLTSTAVAAMMVIAIEALGTSEEPGVYPALRLWLLSAVLLATGRLGSNLFVAWLRSSSRTAAKTIIVGAGRVGRLTAIRLLDHPSSDSARSASSTPSRWRSAGRRCRYPYWERVSISRVSSEHGVDCAVVAFSTDSHDDSWTCSTSASGSGSARSLSPDSSSAFRPACR